MRSYRQKGKRRRSKNFRLGQVSSHNHFVPKFYLRGFGFGKRNQSLWTVHVDEERSLPEQRNVCSIGWKPSLYVQENEKGLRCDRLELELCDLEGTLDSTGFWRLVTTDLPDLSNDACRKPLALLIASMIARNPRRYQTTEANRRFITDVVKKWPETLENGFALNVRDLAVTFDQEVVSRWYDLDPREAHNRWIDDVRVHIGGLAKRILHMSWTGLIVDGDMIITSDYPVTTWDDHAPFSGDICTPNSLSWFPLSSRRGILIRNEGRASGGWYEMSPGGEDFLNWLTVNGASERIFAPWQPDHTFYARLWRFTNDFEQRCRHMEEQDKSL